MPQTAPKTPTYVGSTSPQNVVQSRSTLDYPFFSVNLSTLIGAYWRKHHVC